MPLKWFLALNQQCRTFSHYADMIRVAVLTARQNTRLDPHFIYDGADNELTSWLEANNVKILRHRSKFYPQLEALSQKESKPDILTIGSGAFIRVDLPEVLAKSGITDKYVLYTDCDVMFTGDPEPDLVGRRCRYFAIAPEHSRWNYNQINTGVMLMNIPALAARQEEFTKFILAHLPELVASTWDQEAYRLFYKKRSLIGLNRWNKLPIRLNWKPYWGKSHKAKIIHFHGPKPFQEKAMRERRGPPGLLALATRAYFDLSAEWRSQLEKATSPR